MSEQTITITIQQFILSILILFATYFIFEINKSMIEGVKDLKFEVSKLKIDKTKFKKQFIAMFLENRIDAINKYVGSSYLVFILLLLSLYAYLNDYFGGSLIILAILLSLLYLVSGNIQLNYHIPLYKATVISHNIEEFLIQLNMDKKREYYLIVVHIYRDLNDQNLELTITERKMMKEQHIKQGLEDGSKRITRLLLVIKFGIDGFND